MAHDRDRFDRDRHERDRDERGIVDRAGDEVRSWFGDDEARRRREREDREDDRWNAPPSRSFRDASDDRWRSSGRASGGDRSYSSERPYGDREYGWNAEPSRSEGYRDYGDRYGRSYSSPMDRDRYSSPPDRPFGGGTSSRDFAPNPVFQPYARGSQEFGPEGYGSASYATNRSREWQSSERWRVPGPHAGRGPKGYQRSEERVREEINDRLTAHGLIDATDVEVRIQNGEVTLTGFVDSRDAKRAAEDCADDVQGVREVHNHLRIRSHADDTGVGRTSVLGLTEHDMQNKDTARTLEAREQARAQGDQAARSRPRNQ
jgi:osmotically-inducible protein OsmY